MDWLSYQKEALKTAIYPKGATAIAYTALGLTDEIGEFYEALGTPNAQKELGDVFWYVACFCNEADIDISKVETDALKEIGNSPNFGILPSCDFLVPIDQLRMSSSKICGLVKKYIRDDGSSEKGIPAVKKDSIYEEMSKIVLSIYYICSYTGFSWTEVAQQNLDKLKSRQERGKLKGSGDNR